MGSCCSRCASCCCCCGESTAPVHEPTDEVHLNDVGISTTNPLHLIDGYEKEPVVSLEESLEPFDGKIKNLATQIKHAKASCPQKNRHGLTHDEAAAIYLYSMQGDPNSVHEHLERAWKTNDRSQMMPWFRYLKLLRSGLDKLPDAKGEVWTGTEYDPTLAHTLQSNSSPFYTCMGSCSTSVNELKRDLQEKSISRGKYGRNKSANGKDVGEYKKKDTKGGKKAQEGNSEPQVILVGYKSVDGKDTAGYTEGNKKGVMLWPGMKLGKGPQSTTDGDGTIVMHFKGTNSPQPPPTPIPPSSRKPTTVTPLSPGKSTTGSPPEKHFVCQSPSCGNQCFGRHSHLHCDGCTPFIHDCSHHCPPKITCLGCNTHAKYLHECNKCRDRVCDNCCFK